jgi:hypothetical protein
MRNLMFATVVVTFAVATMFTSSLNATDEEPGLICKIHPTSQKCQQPALVGCDCVNDSIP